MEDFNNTGFENENSSLGNASETGYAPSENTEAVPCGNYDENENTVRAPESAPAEPEKVREPSYFEQMPPRPPVDPALANRPGAVPPPPVQPRPEAFGQRPPVNPDRGPSFERPVPPPQNEPRPIPPCDSGEYRYVPPFAGIGSNTPAGERPAPPPMPEFRPHPEEEKKAKTKVKTVRTFSTTALILILVGAVIISFASGMLGALLVEGGLDFNSPVVNEEPKNDDDGVENDGSGLAINKSDENEEDEKADNSSDASDIVLNDLTDVCAVVSASVVEISTEFNQTYYGYYQYVQEGAGSG
ncbi:MAG: hypothetical protein IKV54_08055, partial [Clostridia bacterium]|nr:hypothetical protein [Clostridia bacterium]